MIASPTCPKCRQDTGAEPNYGEAFGCPFCSAVLRVDCTAMESPRRLVAQLTRQIFPNPSSDFAGPCFDGACVFGHDGGMTTNGGCGCIKGDKVELRRNIQRLATVARELARLVPGNRRTDFEGDTTVAEIFELKVRLTRLRAAMKSIAEKQAWNATETARWALEKDDARSKAD